ncbi:helix-turn-helix domain-containing protein (plasmid) [Cytobacillus spongiae]|uniref:helix-turn-helix transcriptional regulator n=1 Tax=Cytobacillus spongiae TaxID=2901381 RepID=UPI001F15E6F3|nr:helix-turn-helix transcriptional regulator [Cytobacillus spongiae]UII58091.1 helix-turn-helix domain-containing protein [Cytobacillus spongiae]
MEDISRRRETFKSYRKQFKVTQRQLSIDLDVTESHIRNIESGRGNPDARLLFKLARYFETSPEKLFPDLADVKVIRSSKDPSQSLL